MKNYLIAGLSCLIAALTFGIEPVQRVINEAMNRGTLRGVERCIEYSKSELLSQDAVKASCVQSFHNRLYIAGLATGKAGPRTGQRTLSWGGTLENKTPDHVTTWVQIAVIIFDADGTKQKVFAETPVWIDPLGEADFLVELAGIEHEQLDDITFCEDDDEAQKACVSWSVTAVMGLAI